MILEFHFTTSFQSETSRSEVYEACKNLWIIILRVLFGVSWVEDSSRLVRGLRCSLCIQLTMAGRSYVYPSAAMTGSLMSSWVMGQRNSSGVCTGSERWPGLGASLHTSRVRTILLRWP
ncbi:hypothetical protein EGW08_020287, partial [Elysia chlorotica]